VSAHRGESIRRLSIRVALMAAAIVGGLFIIAALVTNQIVKHNLVSSVDSRLQSRLAVLSKEARPLTDVPRLRTPSGGDTLERQLGVPLAIWVVGPTGSIQLITPLAPDLPPDARSASSPATVDLNGTPFRLAGGPAPGGTSARVVVGQSLASVDSDMSTLLVTELIVGPAVLLLVFGGALAVGRRVARPVEESRQRQLAFTADASHELRTPLSVIEAESALALSRDRDAASYRATVERIAEESARLRHIVDSLLWLARFDAAPLPEDRAPVDVGVVLAAAGERFRAVAQSRSLHLHVDAQSDPAPIVVAPPDWIDRVCGVLLANACQYTPPGGSVNARVNTLDGSVRLTVDDSGPGIPADQRERIFDRFHRAVDAEGGAGLGLAIGDAVVRATRGRWEVGDSPQGGASMMVSWPRASAVAAG
jgi:signal transduction histidine kinase